MLALTRKVGESVAVGRSEVTVAGALDGGGATLRVVGPGRDETASVRPGRLAFEVEGVRVYLKGASRGKFRLLFDGPRDVPVARTELLTGGRCTNLNESDSYRRQRET